MTEGMTEELFREDAALTECRATLLAVDAEGTLTVDGGRGLIDAIPVPAY